MITKLVLEKLGQKSINDIKIEDLKDISNVIIDKDMPVADRICSFLEQIGNPYLFKVGDTPVKVSFPTNALSIQKILEILFTKNI